MLVMLKNPINEFENKKQKIGSTIKINFLATQSNRKTKHYSQKITYYRMSKNFW